MHNGKKKSKAVTRSSIKKRGGGEERIFVYVLSHVRGPKGGVGV